MRVELTTAHAVAQELLIAAGVPDDAAELQADLLVVAEAKGVASHGLLRLPRLLRRIANGVADPIAAGRHRWASPTRLVVDGEQGLGPVVAMQALSAARPAARRYGICLVTMTATNHLGTLSYYTERLARDGVLTVALTSSEALVHPWGGTQAMVGTNPVSIGVPAGDRPLVVDMATSEVSMGKIHDYALRDQPLPAGWALDADGNATTDAAAAVHGSVAPFGGPKGYALGMAFGAMISFLTASAYGPAVHGTLDDTEASSKGDVFILVDVEGAPIEPYLELVRASRPGDPDGRVRIPGDRSSEAHRRAQRDGIELPDHLWQELLCRRDRVLVQ